MAARVFEIGYRLFGVKARECGVTYYALQIEERVVGRRRFNREEVEGGPCGSSPQLLARAESRFVDERAA